MNEPGDDVDENSKMITAGEVIPATWQCIHAFQSNISNDNYKARHILQNSL